MAILLILLFIIMILCGRYHVVLGNVIDKQDMDRIRWNIACFILIFITSFRYDVGWDYLTYYRMFNIPGGAPYFEPLVRAIYYISQYFNAPWLFFAIFFTLSMVFILLGIKDRSKDNYESLIMFMALFYFESMNIIRQFLAIAILFYAFKYVKSGKFIPYLIWVYIASLSHTSAWFAIPIYFIYNYMKLHTVFIITVCIMLFADKIVRSVLGLDIFHKYSIHYANLLNDGGNFVKLFYISMACICILIYIFRRRVFDKDVPKSLCVILFGLMFPFLIGSHLGLRITYYYAIELIILIPKMLGQLHIRTVRNLVMLPFYAYYALFLFVDYINNKGFSPFIFYWNRQ